MPFFDLPTSKFPKNKKKTSKVQKNACLLYRYFNKIIIKIHSTDNNLYLHAEYNMRHYVITFGICIILNYRHENQFRIKNVNILKY